MDNRLADRNYQPHAENEQDKTGKSHNKVVGNPRPEHADLGHSFGPVKFFFIGLNKKSDGDDCNERPHGLYFDILNTAENRVPELMNGNGDDKRKPDRKGGWNIFIDTREEQDILRLVDPGRFRLDEQRVADRNKEHQSDEDRNDYDGYDPSCPVEPKERAECGKFVKKPNPVRFDCHNRTIEGDMILPEFPGMDVVRYRCVGGNQKKENEEPVHSSTMALQG